MNIDICRASKDIFDKDITLLVPDSEKQDQSGKENSEANGLGIFEEINKGKMSEEELGPAISSQLAEVTIKYWSEGWENLAVVNKIFEGLKIPGNCSGVHVPILNESVAKNKKIISFHKKTNKRLLKKG